MPYAANADLPPAVKNVLPAAAMTIYRKAFNNAVKKNPEDAARKIAWGAVKAAGYEKSGDSWVKKNYEGFEIKARVTKTHDDAMQAFGWAYVSETNGEKVADHSGEHVPIAELEKGAYLYNVASRDAGEMHVSKGCGTLIESMVFTKEKYEALGVEPEGKPMGWWIGFQVSDEEVWQKVKSGEYPMLSIAGKAIKKEVTA
jgi:cation transport regulator ChaB